MPWELLLLDKFVLFILIFNLLLLSRKSNGLKGVGSLHAKVDGESLFPSLIIGNIAFFDAHNLACAHTLRDLGNDAFLCGFASLINREDVWVNLWVLDDNASHEASQIDYVNRGH